jgi:1,4-dihydroxy-2-naphthoyl-CoA hydrolase
MPYTYCRTIRFADTDAAGVVYFANVLSICHEAYEASLAAAGIELNRFFRSELAAVPIVHAEIDYFQPMRCGEQYEVEVSPTLLKPDKFEVQYRIRALDQIAQADDRVIGRATTIHLCIEPQSRQRLPLPLELQQWLDAIKS